MKVIKNYLYNVVYQILLLLVPLITVPYIARVLGPELVGINSYTNSWMTFFMLVGQMGIALYGNREVAYHRDDPIDRSRIFWGIEMLQGMTILIALGAYLAAVLLFSTTFKHYFLLQSFWIIAAGVDVSWYFMGMEDFKTTVTRNTLVKIISIFLIFLLVRDKNDLIKYIILLGLSSFIGNLTLWPYLRKQINFIRLSKLKPLKHFQPTLLLFIPTITTQIYLVVNRIMLGRMSTQVAVSQFDFGDKMIKLALSLVTATGSVMLPHIANKFAEGDVKSIRNALYKSFDFSTALAIPIMFGLMAISTKFAPWFLGSEYGPTSKVIFYEAPAILFIAWSNVTGTQYLMPIHSEKKYTISVTIGAIVNVIANFYFIKTHGVNGAAFVTVLSEFSILAVQLFFIHGTIKRRQLFTALWKYLLAGFIMYLVVERLNFIMKMNLANLAFQILAGVVIYVIALTVIKAPIIKQALDILMPIFNKKGTDK